MGVLGSMYLMYKGTWFQIETKKVGIVAFALKFYFFHRYVSRHLGSVGTNGVEDPYRFFYGS